MIHGTSDVEVQVSVHPSTDASKYPYATKVETVEVLGFDDSGFIFLMSAKKFRSNHRARKQKSSSDYSSLLDWGSNGKAQAVHILGL